MASAESVSSQDQAKPLEEKVADLKLGEKAGEATDAVHEYVDGVKDAAKIGAKDVAGEIDKAAVKSSEEAKKDADGSKASDKPSQLADSREVDIAEKEAQKSPDANAYVVPTVEHREVKEGGGEEKVQVPTAVVHENADAAENAPQQGKGIIHSITRSVKSVFTGSGGNKGTKSSESKEDVTKE